MAAMRAGESFSRERPVVLAELAGDLEGEEWDGMTINYWNKTRTR
jgi:hypothetical protein